MVPEQSLYEVGRVIDFVGLEALPTNWHGGAAEVVGYGCSIDSETMTQRLCGIAFWIKGESVRSDWMFSVESDGSDTSTHLPPSFPLM